MIFKKYKQSLYKLKWVWKLSLLVFLDPSFCRLIVFYRINSSYIDSHLIKLKGLIRLNPRWAKGHFLLSYLSFRKFQDEREAKLKGTLRLSALALIELNSSHRFADIAQALLAFLEKRYIDSISILEDKIQVSQGMIKPKQLAAFLIELLASAYLIENQKAKAKDLLNQIEEGKQTKEVKTMLSLLK